jgi:hypothetical protein
MHAGWTGGNNFKFVKSGPGVPITRSNRMREMESHGEQSHQTKRVVLPSGKTIEVVYFSSESTAPQAPEHPPAERHQPLHICIECASELVYPVQWEEAGPDNWRVLLHCPNCDIHREGVFTQENVEEFDEELDRGGDALSRDYKRLLRANMADEIDRFVGALEADAILPEDF